jgi:hypothetical protein
MWTVPAKGSIANTWSSGSGAHVVARPVAVSSAAALARVAPPIEPNRPPA